MGPWTQELVALSDDVWERTRRRLDGLTDDEHLWEPAPGCWTIRRRADGRWWPDWPAPPTGPAPVTTLAWRLWHLTDMYGEDRTPRFLGIAPDGPAVGADDPDGQPSPTAAGAIELLERAHDRWDRHLAAVDDAALAEPIGEVGGHHADRTRAAFVLHILDEHIHHGAEIGLLRDLWLAQHGSYDPDPLVERVVRGDESVLVDLSGDAAALERTVAAHPDMVARAAGYARWDLALGLARLGFPVTTPGRTALHVAASDDHLEVVQALLDLGADPDARDDEHRATPLEWARFLGSTRVAESLAARSDDVGRDASD